MQPLVPPASLPFVAAALAAFGIYLCWEIWRWRSGNRASLTAGQFRRRMAGGLILEADLLLWLLANSLMRGQGPAERLLYLSTLMLLVLVVMLLAVRETGFILRQYARWHGELVREMAAVEQSERGPDARG